MSKINFSIIVPVYNTEKYIEKCLDSIYKAIDKDCEIIIINDGSTDDSEKIIKKYIKKLTEEEKKLTKYIYKENKGLADTKNVGIKEAKGKFISVVDSDDRINENFFIEARKYITDYDIIVYDIYTDYENHPEYNHIIRAIREDVKGGLKEQLIHGAMQGSSCNKIIKKDLYIFDFPIGKEYEDVSVTPFILENAKNIKYISNPYYIYLQRKKSIVSSNKWYTAHIKITENISDTLNQIKEKDIKKYKSIITEFFVFRDLNCFDSILVHERKNIKKYLKEYTTNCENVINFILKENLLSESDLVLTNNQKKILNLFYIALKEKNINKAIRVLKFRRIINYIRRIKESLVALIKAIFGGIYYG